MRSIDELPADVIARLRDHLPRVGYTVEGVHDLLGPLSHAALHRNETTPGLRETAGDGPLATLVRLWLLQVPVPRTRAAAALPELLEPLIAAGILHSYGREVCALVDIRPYGVTGVPATGVPAAGVPAAGVPAAGVPAAGGPASAPSRPSTSATATAGSDWWVVADLTPGMDGARPSVSPDHVLGVNNAATTLAQLTVRRPVGRALDLGTGCGIQALHLASHVGRIVATDINPRALAMARLSAGLAGISVTDPPGAGSADSANSADSADAADSADGHVRTAQLEFRHGNLFEPVDGERFDLIVSNPPFVISPRGDLVYRDSGLAGDEVCRRIVAEAPRFLADGGVCQILASWMHIRGEDWRDRLVSWLRTGCDAWVVQREVTDPAEYVELWLKDAGWHGAPGYRERYDEWLAWFEAQNTVAIGYGWITLQREGSGVASSATPRSAVDDALGTNLRARTPGPRETWVEEWTGPVAQPLGDEVTRWLDTVDQMRAYDDEALLAARLRVAGEVDQEQWGRPGAAHPEYVVLRQRSGLCRAERVDTAEAGFVGACDGSMAVGQIIAALATLLKAGEDDEAGEAGEAGEDALRARLLPRIRQLIHEGYLSVSPAAS
jgi:methylase of polypeptide subunit release factors